MLSRLTIAHWLLAVFCATLIGASLCESTCGCVSPPPLLGSALVAAGARATASKQSCQDAASGFEKLSVSEISLN